MDRIKKTCRKIIYWTGNNYLLIAYGIAFSAIAVSLFYSEIMELPPCSLCWFQRIFMYPIAPIGLIAFINKDKYAYRYILSLAIPGALFALYQYILQKTAFLPEIFCSAGASCGTIQVEYLGFITIPLMSFAGFSLIIFASLLARRKINRV